MNTMDYKYAPSVNIIRDVDSDLNYIPTPNAKQAFRQIVDNYHAGIRCFNIVGAYGTGKSSFLWALDRTLNNKTSYFKLADGQFDGVNGFEKLSVVGSYSSVVSLFAQELNIRKSDYNDSDIINKLNKRYETAKAGGKGLLISIDEFGKFLEYAAQNNPEYELYFVQQLCEYVNDPTKNILLVTTLHQDFSSYSRGLSKNQRSEWDKIKGRLKEVTFNEPVEQLLYLASERLASFDFGKESKSFHSLFEAIIQAKVFPLKDYCTEDIAEKLLPLDILAASILTLSLQRYGQNERSLFSFIESHDHLGLYNYEEKEHPYFNLSCVYDYLSYNYYSFITSKYNPHFTQWSAIKSATERAEALLDIGYNEAAKIIKTVGLLNIFSQAGARIDKEFLEQYGRLALGIKNPENILVSLENAKIIRYVKHNSRYVLFEGTDLDIELAIDEAGNLIEHVSDVTRALNKYFEFPYIPAKAAYYEIGTPRYFEFKISESPVTITPTDEIDGFINLVFSEKLQEKQIQKISTQNEEAILYGWYRNTSEIKNLLRELEKVEKVKANNLDDKVAVRELNAILDHQRALLNHYVLGSIYSENSSVIWYFRGEKQDVSSQKSFNRILSLICKTVYSNAPTYKNELVNKTKLSPAISTARKSLINALCDKWNVESLGFTEAKFPPEKTIYLSLLKETGIHNSVNKSWSLQKPTDESFLALWGICEDFLSKSRTQKRILQELVDTLSARPFKLKKGFLDFWLPIFLFIKRDDFALFSETGYIPNLSSEDLELIVKKPKAFEVKAFDIDGVRLDLFNQYRHLVQQTSEEKLSNKSFIETIKPFLVFYKSLPEYAKRTGRISDEAVSLRHAIAQSKDPERAFFEEFPHALGYTIHQLQSDQTSLETYVSKLQESIKEIRTSYTGLIDRFEHFLTEEIIGGSLSFEDYKTRLQKRFKKLKIHVLLPKQKTFYQRIFSPLDDRMSWLNSMAQATIGKPLENFTDADEVILYEKFAGMVHELDNLCEISEDDIDVTKEDVLKFEITSFVEGIQKNLI